MFQTVYPGPSSKKNQWSHPTKFEDGHVEWTHDCGIVVTGENERCPYCWNMGRDIGKWV